MENYWIILMTGFGGGVVRGLVGFIKHQRAYKNVPFHLSYFLTMMFISGTVGLLTSAAIKNTGMTFLGVNTFSPALSFIVGYAGGDFLENIYKILVKKASFYN